MSKDSGGISRKRERERERDMFRHENANHL
jgi:hypothetical protein